MRIRRPLLAVMAWATLAVSCGESSDTTPALSPVPVDDAGDASTDGSAGSGGQAGSAGAAGTAGLGGSAGEGGAAGQSDAGVTDASAGAAGDSGAAGSAGTAGAAGAGGNCSPFGESCTGPSDCCSGVCDDASGTCQQHPMVCSAEGTACVSNTECCSLNCVGHQCQAQHCLGDGDDCSASGNECCSGMCTGGVCQDVNQEATCKTAGNACTDNSDCCSQLCTGGYCQLGVSHCVQLYDVCSDDSHCCSGMCKKASPGDLYGACATLDVGPGRCSDGAAGMVCNTCGSCCSRACAPGPAGVFICQPPSGCRPSGEICKTTLDCCGGDTQSGLPGSEASVVTCEKASPSDEYGRCKSQGCTPQGDVCQLIGGACGESTALPSNCCPTNANPSNPAWKKGECEFDALLVPRCNGLADCVAPGGSCSSSADCCNEMPCVPDPDDGGRLKCYIPADGGPSCVETGGPCTSTSDCCLGDTCIIPPGEIFGTCGDQGTGGQGGGGGAPPDGGAAGSAGEAGAGGQPADGGPGGAGGQPPCAGYGQSCTDGTDCCYHDQGVECISGRCLIQG